MHVATFACPHCQVPLRVRDRRFVGREITCPDCQQPVTIIAENGTLAGVANGAQAEASASPRWQSRISPAMVGWTIAGGLLIGIAGFLLSGPAATDADHDAPPSAVVEQERGGDVTPHPAEDVAHDDGETLNLRLRVIHTLVTVAPGGDGQLPAGTVPAEELLAQQRLSWIAALIAAGDPAGPQPAWDRAWNDPANARFVRRQQPDWLNPNIDRVVSDDRYPATHFVGVAGVGEDAALLPAGHPRAGIFGHDRRIRIADVGDGLANTMLVAGVERQLGSWAAGGRASVRSFTAEPYVNGPDGFGTGKAESMQVLMADGSVRTVSRETSPIVIRRMATMNDGLPLDADVPDRQAVSVDEPPAVAMEQKPPADAANPPAGDALPDDPLLDAARVIADLARPQEVPIDVLLAEPAVTYDVERALAQKIAAFDQKDPVPVRDLLRLVEEMAAVPIRFEELPPESLRRLEEPVTLSLNQTTVGDILQAVIDAIHLDYEGRPEGIFVQGASVHNSDQTPSD